MELKLMGKHLVFVAHRAFNRTAYGIEILLPSFVPGCQLLLIAPLMELKFLSQYSAMLRQSF